MPLKVTSMPYFEFSVYKNFKMGVLKLLRWMQNFHLKLLRWMQNFHQSKWDHESSNADRSLKDRQLSMGLFS
jgi:hypothetical protein